MIDIENWVLFYICMTRVQREVAWVVVTVVVVSLLVLVIALAALTIFIIRKLDGRQSWAQPSY